MSKSKSTKSYPSIYLEYAEALSKEPTRRIMVAFANSKDARAFRLDFNSFKGAALSEGLNEMFPEIAAFYVTVDGATAIVQHKDYTDAVQRLRAALLKD